MENYYRLFLVLHIAAGFTSLFVAPVAMAVKKGSKTHRWWGKVYFWSMCLVALTACVMSIWKTNLFLGMVGVFSFYMVASGYRALYRKNINSLSRVPKTDWLLLGISGLFSMGLLILGGLLLMKNISQPFGYISGILGLIGQRSVIGDVVSFTKPGHHQQKWMYHHMGGMIGGYIATVSAFSVVNFTFLPDLVRWLWPLAIGLPLLLLWIRHYKKKKEPVQIAAT